MSQNNGAQGEEIHANKCNAKTKVVVRNLPYSITEEEVKKTISEFLTQIGYFYFVPGRLSKSTSALEYESVFSSFPKAN
jgi:RNA recognition motif-containing protein